jgi:hypothetical protein
MTQINNTTAVASLRYSVKSSFIFCAGEQAFPPSGSAPPNHGWGVIKSESQASDDLEIISDALKVIPDVLKVISDDLPYCFLVVFLQIIEIGRYSRCTRYAATKFAAFNV